MLKLNDLFLQVVSVRDANTWIGCGEFIFVQLFKVGKYARMLHLLFPSDIIRWELGFVLSWKKGNVFC